MIEFEQLKRIVEAALLASSTPLSLPQLFTLFAEGEQPSHDELARALDELARDCEGRGIELKEVASGFRYQVRSDVNPWVSRLWAERQTRYSRAQLETLALIAYRQPITRGEIENIRGVAVSSNIIKTLEEREWIRTVGHRDVPGKPELFGTTRTFLDYFNLKSLDELPPLAEIRDLQDFEPQMGLAPVATGEMPATEIVDAGEAAETEESTVPTTEAESQTAPASERETEAASHETATGGTEPLAAESVEKEAESVSHDIHAADESAESIHEQGHADEGVTLTHDADTAHAPTEQTP
jgi:segregation and condensation protein B